MSKFVKLSFVLSFILGLSAIAFASTTSPTGLPPIDQPEVDVVNHRPAAVADRGLPDQDDRRGFARGLRAERHGQGCPAFRFARFARITSR